MHLSSWIPTLSLLLLAVGHRHARADDTSLLEGAKAAFGGSMVVPQTIPEFDPLGFLHVFYGPKESRVDVGPAAQFPPERLSRQPYIAFNLTEQYRERMGPPYVLIMVDPDASAVHTSQSCALHWMVTDVYFDQETGMMSSGFLSAAYSRPNPPEGPLHHRYVFLLYSQPLLFLPPIFSSHMAGPRLHFNLPAFMMDYGLGSPVGGNFLKSFWTGVEVKEDEIRPNKPPMTIKASSSPWLAGLIGSIMGLVYAAST